MELPKTLIEAYKPILVANATPDGEVINFEEKWALEPEKQQVYYLPHFYNPQKYVFKHIKQQKRESVKRALKSAKVFMFMVESVFIRIPGYCKLVSMHEYLPIVEFYNGENRIYTKFVSERDFADLKVSPIN